jgi:antitoxin CcdA
MRKIAANAVRQPANLSIDSQLMAEAKRLNVNVSRAAEAGIRKRSLPRRRGYGSLKTARRWTVGTTIDKHGIPLAEHRQF